MKYLLTGETTKRLIFKFVDHSYFDDWINFFKHPDSAKFLGFPDFGTPYEHCTEWFRRVEERYQNDLGGLNALINKETGEFIGQCGLLVQAVDGKMELEIGYSVLPKYWNLGYATEAAIKCRDYAFQYNLTKSLISIIHVDNIKSEKVALKTGMVKTRKTQFKNIDVNIFGIDRSNWTATK